LKHNVVCHYWVHPKPKGLSPAHPEDEELNKAWRGERKKGRSAVVERFRVRSGDISEEFIKGSRDTSGADVYWRLAEILACCDL